MKSVTSAYNATVKIEETQDEPVENLRLNKQKESRRHTNKRDYSCNQSGEIFHFHRDFKHSALWRVELRSINEIRFCFLTPFTTTTIKKKREKKQQARQDETDEEIQS